MLLVVASVIGLNQQTDTAQAETGTINLVNNWSKLSTATSPLS